MSIENEEIAEQEELEITYEYLDNIPYHLLKDKLVELGAEGVFKPGRKKVEMLEEALDIIQKLKIAKAMATDPNDKEELDEIVVDLKIEEEEEKVKASLSIQGLHNAEVEKLVNSKLSIEQLEKALSNTIANNKQAVSEQRIILIKKMKVLEEVLAIRKVMDDGDYEEVSEDEILITDEVINERMFGKENGFVGVNFKN